MNHNTFLNQPPDRQHLRQHEQRLRRRVSNRLTVTNNLLAGGGYTIYPCGNATSVGSSTLDFEGNRIARCGGGIEFAGPGGTWLCADAPKTYPYLSTDGKGWYPRGGSFGNVAYDFCGAAGWVWKNNVWDDNGSPSTC